MELSEEKRKEYEKNLKSVSDTINALMNHLKGRTSSYESLILEKNGKFSHKKLEALIEDMLTLWKKDVYRRAGETPDTEDGIAKQYIKEREELYHDYLYAVMRCSLVKGAFCELGPLEACEKTDFAFLLGNTKSFINEWVNVNHLFKDARMNGTYRDLDDYFGFHLYHRLKGEDEYLSSPSEPDTLRQWYGKMVHNGTSKRAISDYVDFVHDPLLEILETDELFSYYSTTVFEEETPDWDDIEDEIDWSEIAEEASDFYASDAYNQWLDEEIDRLSFLEKIPENFTYKEEYCRACTTFSDHFFHARPEVLRDFYEGIERIVDLYLMATTTTALNDVDSSIEICSRLRKIAIKE